MDVIELTAALIKQPSLTPTDFVRSPDGLETPEGIAQRLKKLAACSASLDILQEECLSIGFEVVLRRIFENIHPEFPYPVDNLVMRIRKGNPKYSICFAGHVDVVPYNPSAWSVDPFGGKIIDGYIYGRGATDMKGGDAAWVVAVSEVIDQLDDVDIYVLFTSDEEAMCRCGARPTLEWMYANGHKPTAFIAGEPSGDEQLGDRVHYGHRGLEGGLLKVIGVGGHTAYPGTYDNPFRILMKAADVLQEMLYAHPKEWSDSPISRFEVTGCVFSHLKNINVIEAVCEASWNIRFTGNYSAQDIADMMQKALDDAGFSRESVILTPRVDLAAQAFNSRQGRLAASIRKAISVVAPGVTPVFNRFGGTGDLRFVQEFDPTAETLEFGTSFHGGIPKSDPRYGKEGGLHMVNECASVEEIYKLTKAYGLVILDFFTAP